MMEFFLSKIWAFLVGMVLMGVLLQGVNMQAQTQRSNALQEVADNIQELFRSMKGIGPGVERSLEMSELLPASVALTLSVGYAALDDDGETYLVAIPVATLLLEAPSGELEQVETLSLGSEDRLMLVTEEQGMTIIAFNPRTCPPDT